MPSSAEGGTLAVDRGWLSRLLSGLWRDRVDWKYGADTGGEIPPAELQVTTPNAAFSHCYRAALGWAIRLFVRRLPVEARDFAFVDFGSGKGRALLVASEFGFREITGVEFCEDLHRIALANIARLPPGAVAGRRIESILQDATAFELPQLDIVCYLYNPFGPPVLDAVVEKLVAHHRKGFAVYAIYINPRYAGIFERSAMFETIFTHRKGVLYRCVEVRAA